MSVLELDTASLTAPLRFEAWARMIGAAFGPFAICRNDPDRFHGRVRVERRQDVRFIELGYDGHAFRRSRRDAAQLNEAYCSLLRPVRGRLTLLQDGEEHVLEPGRFYLVNHSVPYETVPHEGYLARAVAFPPAALESRMARPRSFYALRHEPGSPHRDLLDSFLSHYTIGRQVWSDREFEALTGQLLDLVVMSVAEPDQQPSALEGSTRMAHRARAVRHIRTHLGDRGLTPARVAESCGISLPYLHEIFRGSGQSVEETIFAERLEKAAAMLRTAEHAGTQIATIAYRVGFADPAHFSRAFRRLFGASPSEWRCGSR